jgi:hypothetical protein
MTLLDRTTRRSAKTTAARAIAPAPLGGRYVTGRPLQPGTEGTYVTRGPLARPTSRGTYVTTSTPFETAPGGRYTFSA